MSDESVPTQEELNALQRVVDGNKAKLTAYYNESVDEQQPTSQPFVSRTAPHVGRGMSHHPLPGAATFSMLDMARQSESVECAYSKIRDRNDLLYTARAEYEKKGFCVVRQVPVHCPHATVLTMQFCS